MQSLELPGIELSRMKADSGASKFDLSLYAIEIPEGLSCTFEYNTDLFNADRIERMVGHFETLLEGIVSHPEQRLYELPLLTHREREQLLVEWNDTQVDYPASACLHELFEKQAQQTPEAVAVEFEGSWLCYRELNERANQLAHYLRGMGVGPDTLVGVAMERSLEMVVALYGVLKAGGAYVPIDPEYPQERIAFMLQDADVPVLLTQARLASSLPSHNGRVVCVDREWEQIARQDVANPARKTDSSHLAYMIYTSGSTGRPKGAMNTHRGICNRLLWMQDQYGLTAADKVLQKTPFSFDVSVWEFFWPLLVGARLVVAEPGGHRDAAYLVKLIREQGITVLHFVPSMLSAFLEEPGVEGCQSLRHVICSGEALPYDLQEQFFRLLPSQLHNLYGPTEAAVDVTHWTCRRDDERKIVPIGRPVANTQIYILDRYLQPVPIGVPGELHLGGVQVGRGYHQRPELTAEKFIPDPFSGDPEARLYKTGDLCRWLPDGAVEYLGRMDFQVKLRGFRIELGEIEDTLRQHPAVYDAVVTVREDTPGDKRLVAYYTGPDTGEQGEAVVGGEALRRHLARSLPGYMVPVACVKLKALPLTPNGKLDRKALPAPERDGRAVRKYEAPQGEVETTLAGIWADVLKVERVGRHDHFFELGGHSLLAVTLIERMRRKGLHADVRALFSTPTLVELAAAVGCQGRHVEVPPNLIPRQCDAITPEMLPLAELSATEIERIVSSVPGGAANVQDVYPLAPLQGGILFHHLMAGKGDPYLLAMLQSFDSRARLDAYLGALQAVMDRHDILRTAVVWEGLREPMQVVWRKAPMPVEEIQFDPAGGDVAEQLRERFDPRHYRIDLRQAPLIRAHITHDAANERWLVLMLLHHLVGDHTTLEVMQEEMQAHLLGQADRLPAPLPFRNFVAQARLGMSQEEHERFFRRMLADVDGPTAPFGLLNVQGDGSEIEEARLEVDAGLARRLRERARKLGVSAASLCHLAWAQVLARVSGREDVVFGTVLFGRMQGGEGADRVLGLFINTLPARIRVGEEGVEASARATHTQLADLLWHEHASLALAQRCSAVPSHAPLFSALLNYRHSPRMAQPPSAEAMQAWEGMQRLYAEERTNYPFTLSVSDLGEGFILTAQVPALIGPMRVCEFMHTALDGLVEALETAPATAARSIDVVPESERRRVLEEWNDTKADFPSDKCIHELFEQQAQRTPGAVAVVFKDLHLTYDELNSRSNRLADHLRSLGVEPDMPVGICAERSLEMIVGVLGILKAGGAYVPLDPTYPMERLSFMIQDAGVTILLTQDHLSSRVPRHLAQVVSLDQIDKLAPTNEPRASRKRPKPDGLAYVMYTSGSTGKPKGVEITHRGVVRLLFGADYASFGDTEVFLQMAPLSFDASTYEIWGALLHGGKLVIYPAAVPTTHELRTALLRNEVSTLFLTTSLFNVVIDEAPGVLSSVRQLLFGGEAVSVKHVRRALELLPGTQLIHCYGPTECTTFATCFRIPKDLSRNVSSIPIGRPIANTSAYILDRYRQLAPRGVPGELHLGGDGLARGYLKRPELTGEKFIPNPFTNEQTDRLYATGDLARLMPDGNIEFLGRLDDQVKIHGFRIEPGEIESVLASHPGVKQSAVIAREDKSGDRRLYAYVVQRADQSITVSDLQRSLRQRLPSYMMPSEFITLEALPLTPNGKVDRKALPAPQPGPEAGYVRPRSPLELQIAEIWEELLGVRPIGVRSDFFELGGHSLLAVRMMNQIKEAFGVELPLASLFAGATIEHLAQRLLEAEREKFKSPLVEVQGGGSRQPFFFLHGDFSGGGFFCRKLARFLGSEQPFYAILPHGFGDEPIPRTIEAMAADRLQTLLEFRPHGPYLLGGHCNGALVAFEMARQMEQRGLRADLVVIVDGSAANVRFAWLRSFIGLLGFCFRKDRDAQADLFIRARRFLFRLEDSWHQSKLAALRHLWKKKKRIIEILFATLPGRLAPARPIEKEPQESEKDLVYGDVVRLYVPRSYKGRVVFLRTSEMLEQFPSDPTAGWSRVAPHLKVFDVPGDHLTCLTDHAKSLAATMSSCLQAAAPAYGGEPPTREESRRAAT